MTELVAFIMLAPMFTAAQPTEDASMVTPGVQVEQQVRVTVGEDDDAREVSIPYLLFAPSSYADDERRWPLLLFLHGLGESGDGNLQLVKKHGPPKMVDREADFPFVVVSPQCPQPKSDFPRAWQADQLIQLVDHVAGTMRVDSSRIYVTGLSMGGYGTWRLAAKYPQRFAAVVPICGGGDIRTAERLAKLPIWCFHGAKDNVVPLAESERMVTAVQAAGGNVKLTVYPESGHDSWTETYNNRELYQWLLRQRLPEPTADDKTMDEAAE